MSLRNRPLQTPLETLFWIKIQYPRTLEQSFTEAVVGKNIGSIPTDQVAFHVFYTSVKRHTYHEMPLQQFICGIYHVTAFAFVFEMSKN